MKIGLYFLLLNLMVLLPVAGCKSPEAMKDSGKIMTKSVSFPKYQGDAELIQESKATEDEWIGEKDWKIKNVD